MPKPAGEFPATNVKIAVQKNSGFRLKYLAIFLFMRFAVGADLDLYSNLLKFGFIGFAIAISLVALNMFQQANEKGINRWRLQMFLAFLAFSLVLAVMGLFSPLIRSAHDEEIAKLQHDLEDIQNQDREKLSKVQRDLEDMLERVQGLLDLKVGAVARLQQSLNLAHDPRFDAAREISNSLKNLDTSMAKAIRSAKAASP